MTDDINITRPDWLEINYLDRREFVYMPGGAAWRKWADAKWSASISVRYTDAKRSLHRAIVNANGLNTPGDAMDWVEKQAKESRK